LKTTTHPDDQLGPNLMSALPATSTLTEALRAKLQAACWLHLHLPDLAADLASRAMGRRGTPGLHEAAILAHSSARTSGIARKACH
jgi:hypothetical protein